MGPSLRGSKRVEARLEFAGPAIDPDIITAALGLPAAEAWRRGEWLEQREAPAAAGYWGIDSPATADASVVEHLEALLALLASRREAMERLRAIGYTPALRCRCEYARFAVPSTLLARLGDFGLELRIDEMLLPDLLPRPGDAGHDTGPWERARRLAAAAASRTDFVAFLGELAASFRHSPDRWEHWYVESYLDAMQRLMVDLGHADTPGDRAKHVRTETPDWATLAWILLSAAAYE